MIYFPKNQSSRIRYLKHGHLCNTVSSKEHCSFLEYLITMKAMISSPQADGRPCSMDLVLRPVNLKFINSLTLESPSTNEFWNFEIAIQCFVLNVLDYSPSRKSVRPFELQLKPKHVNEALAFQKQIKSERKPPNLFLMKDRKMHLDTRHLSVYTMIMMWMASSL